MDIILQIIGLAFIPLMIFMLYLGLRDIFAGIRGLPQYQSCAKPLSSCVSRRMINQSLLWSKPSNTVIS